MPITEPTKFNLSKASGTAKKFIVRITDGVSVWLLGNHEGNFTDGATSRQVLPLVSHHNFTQSVDNIGKSVSRAIVNLQVINLPYKVVGSTHTRFSDEISNIIGLYGDKPAAIYITADPNETSLANCLCIFNGIVRNMITFTTDTMTITLEDRGYLLDKIILTSKVKDAI